MTEHMLRMHLDALVAAALHDDSKAALEHSVAIVGQLLLDIHR